MPTPGKLKNEVSGELNNKMGEVATDGGKKGRGGEMPLKGAEGAQLI